MNKYFPHEESLSSPANEAVKVGQEVVPLPSSTTPTSPTSPSAGEEVKTPSEPEPARPQRDRALPTRFEDYTMT